LQQPKKDKIRKAAKMLLALGQEGAAQVLRHLDAGSLDLIMAEILQIESIDAHEKDRLLKEFQEQVKSIEGVISGGKAEAQKLLENALGAEKAQEFIERLQKTIPDLDFKFFERFSPKSLGRVMAEELPQTVAVILTHLPAKLSASVMETFDSAFSATVARKIATMNVLHPDAVKSMYYSLRARLEKLDEQDILENDGEDKLTAILAHMDLKNEEQILESLREDEPDMADRIRASLFVFEDLQTLTQQELRKIFGRVGDQNVWALALKGTGRDFRRYLLSCVSINRASDIADEMTRRGAVPLSEIESNRSYVLGVAEELNRQGEVILRKEKEKFIE